MSSQRDRSLSAARASHCRSRKWRSAHLLVRPIRPTPRACPDRSQEDRPANAHERLQPARGYSPSLLFNTNQPIQIIARSPSPLSPTRIKIPIGWNDGDSAHPPGRRYSAGPIVAVLQKRMYIAESVGSGPNKLIWQLPDFSILVIIHNAVARPGPIGQFTPIGRNELSPSIDVLQARMGQSRRCTRRCIRKPRLIRSG